MSFRPSRYPCRRTDEHEGHQHTEGPDHYYYFCTGDRRITQFRITTESGSSYVLDTEAKTLTRTPGPGAAPVMHDNKPFRYEYFAFEPQQGKPLMAYWDMNGRPKLRSTTPVVSIEEIQ